MASLSGCKNFMTRHYCTQPNLWQEMLDHHGLVHWLFMFSRDRCLPIAVSQWNKFQKTIYNTISSCSILSVSDGSFTMCPLLRFLHRWHCLCKRALDKSGRRIRFLPSCASVLCAGWKSASQPFLKRNFPPEKATEHFSWTMQRWEDFYMA